HVRDSLPPRIQGHRDPDRLPRAHRRNDAAPIFERAVDVQETVASAMKVAVLCGGLGTRLGGLAQGLPKPMISIGGRPYLERVLESFAERGLRSFVLLTGYKHEIIESHFGDGSRFGVHIEYSREPEPIGTGGALRIARPLFGERFVLTFGDVLRRFDYDRFVTRHADNCLAVYPRIASGNA